MHFITQSLRRKQFRAILKIEVEKNANFHLKTDVLFCEKRLRSLLNYKIIKSVMNKMNQIFELLTIWYCDYRTMIR